MKETEQRKLDLWRMSTAEDPDLYAVAALLSTLPDAATGVVRFANSSYVGAVYPVERVLDAVVRIGCRQVGALVLATINSGVSDDCDAPAIGEGSLAAGRAARLIGRLVGASNGDCESLFVAGLFSGAGACAIVAEDAEYLSWRARQVASGVDDAKILRREQMAYGTDHVVATSRRLLEWNMPTSIIDVVSAHHSPRNRIHRVLSTAMMVIDRSSPARCHSGSFSVEMQALGLEQHVTAIRDEALRYVDAVRSTEEPKPTANPRPKPVPNFV